MEARFEDVEHRLHLPEFKLQTLLMLAVLALAVHILLPQVGEFRHSIRAIKRADWGWMVPALVTTAATFLFATVALRAASGRPLPFWRTTEAQLASSFANRLAPGSVGGLGVNERFLCKVGGLGNAEAGAALALNGLAGVLIHVSALVLVGIAASNDGGHTHIPHPRNWQVATAFALILAIAGIIWRVPRLQSHILPALKQAWAELAQAVRRPKQALLLFGGALGITSAYAATFGLCLIAFHVRISPAQAAVVYLGGAVVSAAAPTPGGLGAMEAALVAGLTHIGVADGKAVASVLTFRLLTYWLPILPGYLSLHNLRRAKLL
jgi:glycosyltransferase 2 family protein